MLRLASTSCSSSGQPGLRGRRGADRGAPAGRAQARGRGRARARREAAGRRRSPRRDEIIALCAQAGVRGAVGHVERFNPALLELRRRALDGQLGERLPDRHRARRARSRTASRDVGVVKDLATHDLDLVRWLGDSPIDMVAAQTSHRMGRDHEDLVLVTGRLASGRHVQLASSTG